MPQKLSCLQAYRVMLRCFDNLYFQTYDDDVSFLVGNAALYSASNDSLIQPETMDPAVWHDWMDGLKIVLDDPLITWDKVELTNEQAYQAAGQYFAIHCNIGLFENIGKLRDLLKGTANNPELSLWLRRKWDQALVVVLQESILEKRGHCFGGSTELTERESFLVMQCYLDNICRKNQNRDLIELLLRSRILNYHTNYWQDEPDIVDPIVWQFWIKATDMVMEVGLHKKLNLIVAYKILPKFLLGYFYEKKTQYIRSLTMQFEVNKQDEPVIFNNWLAFNNAAVEVNAQQTEIVYNLVSINTPIDCDAAKKIIASWFEKYSLNLGWIEYFDQACEIIIKRPRSYLLLDGEITVLETYHIVLLIVDAVNQVDPNETLKTFLHKNAIGQADKSIGFIQLLEWIRCAEQVCQ